MRKNGLLVAVIAVASCLAISVAAQPDSPTPFVGDTSQLTREASDFRRVLHTGEHLQLVLMTLWPGESIGAEVHDDVDQCLFVVEGVGRAVLDGETADLTANSVVCVPPGIEHDVENTGAVPMRLYTLYAPPEHAPDTVHATRADAEAAEATETAE